MNARRNSSQRVSTQFGHEEVRLTGAIAADTAWMRTGAEALSSANVERTRLVVQGAPGSPRSLAAVERFVEYWDPALSAMTDALDALAGGIASAAAAYELRDAISAGTFDGQAHAF